MFLGMLVGPRQRVEVQHRALSTGSPQSVWMSGKGSQRNAPPSELLPLLLPDISPYSSPSSLPGHPWNGVLLPVCLTSMLGRGLMFYKLEQQYSAWRWHFGRRGWLPTAAVLLDDVVNGLAELRRCQRHSIAFIFGFALDLFLQLFSHLPLLPDGLCHHWCVPMAMPLPSMALTVPCKPPAITRLEPSSRVPRAMVLIFSWFPIHVYDLRHVLSMLSPSPSGVQQLL